MYYLEVLIEVKEQERAHWKGKEKIKFLGGRYRRMQVKWKHKWDKGEIGKWVEE